MSTQRGQVLVFVALVLPIVLLPAAAFAVDAASVTTAQARLEEAAAAAAESAVQQIDLDSFRSGAGVALDQQAAVQAVREAIAADDPDATIERVTVDGLAVRVSLSARVELPLNFLGAPANRIHAGATARLALGYESPSSFLPFSVSTF